MKKLVLAAAAVALLAVAPALSQEEQEETQAQEDSSGEGEAQEGESESSDDESKPVWDHGDNVSKLMYKNFRIYKIYDQRDAYIVLYERQNLKVGTAVIPKKWASNKEGARKLYFRTLPKGLYPYMTVFQEDGEFYKVWIAAPLNRYDSLWAVAPSGTKVEGTDADTLEIEY